MLAANEKEVPVIDLTSNEDIDECAHTSMIDSTKIPPLDINGNEILISTNTKTMQAIAYKKAIDTMKCSTATRQLPFPMQPTTSSISSADSSSQSPILFANLTQNGCRMPPKEQIKFVTKYNRWMRYFRTYNGFHLFAKRNHSRAQAYAIGNNDKSFVHNTLLKWWNTISTAEKEQYIQVANALHTKKHKLCIPQSSANDAQINGTISKAISSDFDTSTNKAIDVNVNRNTEADVNTAKFAETIHSFGNLQR